MRGAVVGLAFALLAFGSMAGAPRAASQPRDAAKIPCFGCGTPLPPPPPYDPSASPNPAPQPPPGPEPCAGLSEKEGIVTLAFTDPTRSGQETMVKVDDITYGANFDGAGKLQFEAPLLQHITEVAWDGLAGEKCIRHGVIFDNYENAHFTALVWEGSYDLWLRVVEPEGSVGSSSDYIYPDRPNLDLMAGYGYLRGFGTGVAGTSHVWLYTLPANRSPGTSGFWFYVDFASRGNPARAPYCGDDPQATPRFEVYHLESGNPSPRMNLDFDPAACGTRWDDDKNSWIRLRW